MTFLTRLSLANRAVIALVTFLIVAIGIAATVSLRQELVPSTAQPAATVVLAQPGSSPATFDEQSVTRVVAAVRAVDGVDTVRSATSSGQATVSATWAFGGDSAAIVRDIESAVAGAISGLPQKVTSEVFAGSSSDIPVLMLTATSDDDIQALAEKVDSVLVPRLSEVPGVREVTISGRVQSQVVVTLDRDALAEHEIDESVVRAILGTTGMIMPAGLSVDGDTALAIEVGRETAGVADIAATPIPSQNGPVALDELGKVELVPVEASSYARADGRPSLGIMITKTPAGNSVQVSHAVAAAIEELTPQLGAGASIGVVFDQATLVESSIHDLSVEGGLGLLFAVLVILVFLLSLRATIITAVSIPLSLLIAIIGLAVGGHSLNVFTLAALTVAVGRVVDDSIVVIENIIRRSGGAQLTPDGVRDSVAEVAGAITASTLTTVAVFLPVAFIGGFAGELFRPFAVAVAVALLASLLVSLTIVPVLAYWLMRRPSRRALAEASRTESDPTHVTAMQRAYLPALRFALRRPIAVVLAAVLLFAGTIGAVGLLKTDLIGGFIDPRAVKIQQELPLGTTLDAADAAARSIESALAANPDVASYTTTVGSAGSNVVSLDVVIDPQADPTVALAGIRDDLSRFASAGELSIGVDDGSVGSSTIDVVVSALDETELREASQRIADALAGLDTVARVTTDLAAEQPILSVRVDEKAAAAQGFTQAEVGSAIAAAVMGEQVGSATIDGNSLPIVLRSQETDASPDSIGALTLPVSALQLARAQKAAADRLAAEQAAIAAQGRQEAEDAGYAQLAELASSRASLVNQLAALRAQLAHLQANPPSTGSGTPATTDDLAAQEYAAQLASLQAAIAQVQDSIPAIDAQIASVGSAQDKAAQQQAVSDRLEAEQKAMEHLRVTPITVDSIAEVTRESSVATITRIDGARAVTVSAKPAGDDLGATSADIDAAIANLDLPAGVTVSLDGASKEQAESFSQLGLAMLLAIALVYIVMVATFRSLLQPLVLLVSVPFAATGAVAGLLVTSTPLGIPALIGLLMLIGIVVTNAIVLIDLVNRRRRSGDSIDDAVLNGARLRLRPIIMTATATIFALVPMAIGITGGGLFISQSLAIVVIGGLVSSTLLTLLIVPALYVLVERRRERRAQARPGGDPVETESEPPAPVLAANAVGM